MQSYFIHKYFYHICRVVTLIALIGTYIPTFAYTPFDDVVNEISAAIKARNAKRLSASFASNVSLSVKRDEGSYTKFQAELLLDDFFRTNKVVQLKELQQANNSSNSFIVFSLKSNASTFRVFIKLVSANKGYEITELRIE